MKHGRDTWMNLSHAESFNTWASAVWIQVLDWLTDKLTLPSLAYQRNRKNQSSINPCDVLPKISMHLCNCSLKLSIRPILVIPHSPREAVVSHRGFQGATWGSEEELWNCVNVKAPSCQFSKWNDIHHHPNQTSTVRKIPHSSAKIRSNTRCHKTRVNIVVDLNRWRQLFVNKNIHFYAQCWTGN